MLQVGIRAPREGRAIVETRTFQWTCPNLCPSSSAQDFSSESNLPGMGGMYGRMFGRKFGRMFGRKFGRKYGRQVWADVWEDVLADAWVNDLEQAL